MPSILQTMFFKSVFVNEDFHILIKFSLRNVVKGPNDNKSSLSVNKPLHEPISCHVQYHDICNVMLHAISCYMQYHVTLDYVTMGNFCTAYTARVFFMYCGDSTQWAYHHVACMETLNYIPAWQNVQWTLWWLTMNDAVISRQRQKFCISGVILDLCTDNERWHYFVMTSLIGWGQV